MSGINDPISDYIVRLKSANLAYKKTVDVPMSNIKLEITKQLKANNFIKNYKIIKDRKQGIIKIYLKYEEKLRFLTDMKRASKPGRRKYAEVKTIDSIRGDFGLTIVSTSKGILSGKEAKEKNVGGEILCYVW